MIVESIVFAEDHLPRQLHHRDVEADHLLRTLQPVVDSARAEDVRTIGRLVYCDGLHNQVLKPKI